jgi:enamine deaminase RidA (YjgF/YER057c/UK114 family)
MSFVSNRLKALGITLPPVPEPVGTYVPAVVVDDRLVFVSGHGPVRDGTFRYHGKVGDTVPLEEARQAARLVVLNALASLQETIGDLDRVRRVVKLLGFVASHPSFTEQPRVIDAASDLLVEVFGDRGRHARSAVGVATLPFDIPVEIEMVVEIE